MRILSIDVSTQLHTGVLVCKKTWAGLVENNSMKRLLRTYSYWFTKSSITSNTKNKISNKFDKLVLNFTLYWSSNVTNTNKALQRNLELFSKLLVSFNHLDKFQEAYRTIELTWDSNVSSSFVFREWMHT